MRKIIIVFVFFMLPLSLFAEQTMRIMVYPFKNTGSRQFSWISAGLTETLISDLKRSENQTIEIISSADRKKALKELAFQQSGLVSEKQITKIGKLSGANTICTGSYLVVNGRIRIFVRISSIEPRKVLKDSKLTGSIKNLFEIQDKIAVNLMKDAGDVRVNNVAQVVTTEEEIKNVNEAYRPKPEAFKWYSKGLEIQETNPKKAMVYFEKAIRISTDYVDALQEAGWTAGNILNLFPKGLAYLQQAKSVLIKYRKQNTVGYARLMMTIGIVNVDKDNLDRALEYYDKSKVIRDRLGLQNTVGYASLMMNVGLVYVDKDNLDRALEYYDKSKKIQDHLGLQDTVIYAKLMNNIGIVYVEKDNLDRALEYYLQAKTIQDRLGLQKTDFYATLMNNIGIVYVGKGNLDRALEYYLQAKTIQDRLGLQNTVGYSSLMMNIGLFYWNKGNLDRALKYYDKSKKIRDGLGLQDTVLYVKLMINIGVVYVDKGKLDRAIEYYLQAKTIQDRLGLQKTAYYALLMMNIGVVYHHKGKIDHALEYYGKAKKKYDGLGLQNTNNYNILLTNIRGAKNR